jgi:hypothetical protein
MKSLLTLSAGLLFIISACQTSQSPPKENTEETPKSEFDQVTYEIVTSGAEKLIVSYEQLLNKLLAENISKEERDEQVHESIFSDEMASQIFDNPDVIIEDDIGPDFYLSEKIKDLKVSRYLSDLYLFLEKDESNSIKFENIKTLQIKEGKDVFVIVYFESRITGIHSLETFPYKTTKRIATIKAEKNNTMWKYSIMSIGFYEMSTVKNDFTPRKTQKII